jgi:hypothetical protein
MGLVLDRSAGKNQPGVNKKIQLNELNQAPAM